MDQDDITYYNCYGKADGNYVHPYNCHQFITCHNNRAGERDCAVCHTDPTDCPDGRLYYHHPSNACEWYHIAGCNIDPDSLVGDPEVLDEFRNRVAEGL
jgi:hypothetical protein